MKSVVCVPTIKDFYYTPHRGSFIGAKRLSILLKKIGFENKLFIFPQMKSKPKTTILPKKLKYLEPYLNDNNLLFFKSYKRFGYLHEYCAKLILQTEPNIIFISCFAFCYANETFELAEALKKLNSKIPIVVGGAGVTVFEDFFKRNPNIDYVLSGKVEEILPDFLNLIFNVKIEPEIEHFPYIFTKTKIFKNHIQYSSILSEGCPKKCSFCANHLTAGRKLILTNIKNVEKSIFQSNETKKIYLNFEDDNIFFFKDYFFEILNIFKKKFKDIRFSCENGIDYLQINEADIEKMAQMGFKQLNFSLVSINEKTLQNNNRAYDHNHFEKLIKTAQKLKLPVFAYFIIGLKNDTLSSVKETIKFLSSLKVTIGISPFYPVPGVKYFEDKSLFFRYPPYLFAGSSCYPWNNSISTAEMIYLFDNVRRINLSAKSQSL
jgi:uncharacterized radical SAM superfamily protein